jgi:hypothetical protein
MARDVLSTRRVAARVGLGGAPEWLADPFLRQGKPFAAHDKLKFGHYTSVALRLHRGEWGPAVLDPYEERLLRNVG